MDAEGKEANTSDYQVYSDVSKHGFHDTYAIQKLENGICYLIGIGETEGDLEVSVNSLNFEELYSLANLCDL
jgi:hypothetical protein